MSKWQNFLIIGLLVLGLLFPGSSIAADDVDEEVGVGPEWSSVLQETDLLAAVNLIRNGSFEVPLVPPTGFRRFFAGSAIGAWHVLSGSVDILGPLWKAARGKQSLDLSGAGAGRIFQDITTIPGRTYQLSFWMAGNPDGLPLVKRMRVFRGATLLATLSFNTFEKARDKMGWEFVQLSFTANSAITRISFVSLTLSQFGPVLDGVQLVEQAP